jgi:hypothetical protein
LGKATFDKPFPGFVAHLARSLLDMPRQEVIALALRELVERL